jgi:hypothetical protein
MATAQKLIIFLISKAALYCLVFKLSLSFWLDKSCSANLRSEGKFIRSFPFPRPAGAFLEGHIQMPVQLVSMLKCPPDNER